MINAITLIVLALTSSHLFGYETPAAVREKYKLLYQTPVVNLPDGSRVFHRAKLFRRQNLYVLSLEGDPFEMAFQHGRLLKNEIAQGAMPQLAKMVENAVRNVFPNIPLVTDLIIKYLYRSDTEGIMEYGIQSQGGDREKFMLEAYGISEGSELPLDDVIHAAFGPESLQVILGKQKSSPTLFEREINGAVLRQACTDFVARGDYTESGHFIIGRNTDYPLNGYFDRFPTIIYYHPSEGNQRYMALTSAGVHNAGVVGTNESGLYLGVHTIPSLEVSEKGTPTFVLGQEVLKTARSFDEAIQIFQKHRTAAAWTYTLASTEENRVGIVELSNDRVVVTENREDLLVQTNHFVSPEMQSANLDLNATVNEDTRARQQRVREMAKERIGTLDAQEAVNILSDKWDRIHRKMSSMGNTVAVHTTLSSLVFDSKDQKIYVASGLAPVSLSTYIEVPSVKTFNPATFSSEDFRTLENSTYYTDYPQLAQAEQLYIEAKTAYDSDLKPKRALEILNEVTALVPDHPAYHFVKGIMALKSDQFDQAEKAFSQCERLHYPHYQLLGHFYLGRILAAAGEKEKALTKFNLVVEEASAEDEVPLLKATFDNIKKLNQKSKLKLNPATLAIFMPEADMLKY